MIEVHDTVPYGDDNLETLPMDVEGLPTPAPSPPNTSPVESSEKKSASGRRVQYQVRRVEYSDEESLGSTLELGGENDRKCEAPKAEAAHPPSNTPSYEAGGFRPFKLGNVAACINYESLKLIIIGSLSTPGFQHWEALTRREQMTCHSLWKKRRAMLKASRAQKKAASKAKRAKAAYKKAKSVNALGKAKKTSEASARRKGKKALVSAVEPHSKKKGSKAKAKKVDLEKGDTAKTTKRGQVNKKPAASSRSQRVGKKRSTTASSSTPKSKIPKTEKKPRKAKVCKSKVAEDLGEQEAIGDPAWSPQGFLDWIQPVMPFGEWSLDDLKEHVRSSLPKFELARLNIYWTSMRCGVTLKSTRKDCGYFNIQVDKSLHKWVGLLLSIQSAAWMVSSLNCFL